MKYMILYSMVVIFACGQSSVSEPLRRADNPSKQFSADERIDSSGMNIISRFSVPEGYLRTEVETNSFQHYLRHLPLKPHGSNVYYYNGRIKGNYEVYDAVVDLDIGTKNLHQCADAVMRLMAEYLYSMELYDRIHFNFTNGFRVDYSEWMHGKRIKVEGNRTWWIQAAEPSNTYKDFWSYMEIIFMYAGTLSLSAELQSVEVENLSIGDVFIQGGSPGHAIIVVDMAENIGSGEKIFLLAQSYMPAQDVQILKNPEDSELSPWYSENFGEQLITPEWIFNRSDLKRFKEE